MNTKFSLAFRYNSPLLISGLYVFLSILWIIFSDRAVALIAGGNLAVQSFLQTVKGMSFVVATGVMLFLLIRSRLNALQESESRYRTLFEAAGDGVMLLNPQGIVDCNQQTLNLFGYAEKKEIIGCHPLDLSPEMQDDGIKSSDLVEEKIHQVKSGELAVFEWKHTKKNGEEFYVSLSLSLVDAKAETMVSILRDITELKRAQQNLRRSLQEKETLLYELYHRTKNNMQVISAFLDLQAISSDNEQVKRIIIDSQYRIRSMALAHEMLYQSKNLSSINMKEYIVNLTRLILQSSSITSKKIAIDIDADHLYTLIDIAIPCGLVLTELITNSIKYAFPADHKGLISVKLHRRSEKQLELTYQDNGKGMPMGFDIAKSPTFGIPLMVRIIKNQLHGSLDLKSSEQEGSRWIIQIREDIYSERV